jgi:hypothetical protein
MELIKGEEFLTELNDTLNKQMNEIEKEIISNAQLEVYPLVHRFTDGLYTREISLPKGHLLTSRTHKVQHQFYLLSGAVFVWDNYGNQDYLKAPYIGITEKNTRRFVYVIEDCVWATTHPNPKNEVLENLEVDIFEDDTNVLLTDEMREKIKEAQNKSYELSKTINNNLIK